MSKRTTLELSEDGDHHHPIQLTDVTIRRLEYFATKTPQGIQDEAPPSFSLQTAHSPFDVENNLIQVALRFGPDEEVVDLKSLPFILRAEIIGFFSVNTEIFPMDKIEEWAQETAPLLLLPYLREQVYSLSIRVQIPPILLPLMQVPVFSISEK